jgi:hypothetical protein
MKDAAAAALAVLKKERQEKTGRLVIVLSIWNSLEKY